jgi:hypothetical protein
LKPAPDAQGWQRGQFVAALAFIIFACWQSVRAKGWRRWVWLLSGGAVAGDVTVAGAAGVAGAVTVGVASGGALAVAAAAQVSIKRGQQGGFLAFFLPAMISVCFVAAFYLPYLAEWETTGPSLLSLGLLTLLNAPFDWASLGLTRALLRRGLELGGWWPYLLALVDACLAGVMIALLALTMVIGVQTFDELAIHGGGEKAAVLPLDALFDGIATNPAAPEYWWAYALLLSTMIPSLINLAIGGMAFTRGFPGLPRLLLLWTPEGRDVPEYKRSFVGRRLNAPSVCRCLPWHSGPGVPRLGPHLPCHDRPRPARHGPRRRDLRRTGAGRTIFR